MNQWVQWLVYWSRFTLSPSDAGTISCAIGLVRRWISVYLVDFSWGPTYFASTRFIVNSLTIEPTNRAAFRYPRLPQFKKNGRADLMSPRMCHPRPCYFIHRYGVSARAIISKHTLGIAKMHPVAIQEIKNTELLFAGLHFCCHWLYQPDPGAHNLFSRVLPQVACVTEWIWTNPHTAGVFLTWKKIRARWSLGSISTKSLAQYLG